MLGEYRLGQLALLAGVVGIIFLFYYSYSWECIRIPIGSIGSKMLEERVCVKGIVDWSHEGGEFLLFGLNDGNSIKVIKFGSASIEGKRIVSVKGTVQEYRGEIEIVAEEIW